jgi:hypothetical protein
MYRQTITFYKLLEQGLSPTPYIFIKTSFGTRVYSDKDPGSLFSFGTYYFDGSWKLDGSVIAGDELIIDIQNRVKSFGNCNKTIQPNKYELLVSSQIKRQQSVIISLNNVDNYLSKVLGKEPFLGQNFYIYVGFFTIPRSEHLKIFSGKISKVRREKGNLYLTIIES